MKSTDVMKTILSKEVEYLFNEFEDIGRTNNEASLSFCKDEDGWREIQNLLYRMNKTKFNHNKNPQLTNHFPTITIPTKYTFGFRKCIIVVETQRGKYDNDNLIKITIHGLQKYKMREWILHQLYKKHKSGYADTIIIDRGYNRMITKTRTRSFYDIILEKQVRRDIISGIWQWEKDASWYHEHHLQHKLGILLYGSPGTGKTSIVGAISNVFNDCPIVYINMFDMMNSYNSLIQMRKSVKGKIIVLMEDFDFACQNLRSEGTGNVNSRGSSMYLAPVEQITSENQQMIFQLLDGVLSVEDVIYIATTNHIERLDKALIRHGRFDIQVELTGFDEKRAIEYVKLFGYDKRVLDSLDISYPIQPVKLQNEIMKYRVSERSELKKQV